MPHAPFSFVHITDTHIKPTMIEATANANGLSSLQSAMAQMDTYQKFHDALEMVHDLRIQPAFFVISGDLTDRGDAESYERLKHAIDAAQDRFGAPFLVNLGNHDNHIPFRQTMLGQVETDEAKPYYFSQVIGDVRVIMLDSKVPQAIGGLIDATQMQWLASQLAIPAPAAGNLIALHHPPLLDNADDDFGHSLKNSAELAAVLSGHPILGILSGHIHFHNINLFAGMLSVTSAAITYLSHPQQEDEIRILDGAGFSVMRVENGRMTANPIILPGPQTEVGSMRISDIMAYMAQLKAKGLSH